MDAIAEQLVSRLRSDPNDAQAYEALKAHYRDARDAPSLTNLIAGWAAYQRDRHKASRGFYEAAQVVAAHAPQHERRIMLLRKAIERDVEYREAVVELVDLLDQKGEDHALAEFLDQHLRALEQHPKANDLSALLYVRLAELWHTQFERSDVARQCYERALDLDSANPDVYFGARRLAEASDDAPLLARALGAQAQAEAEPEQKAVLFRAQAEAYTREPADLNGAVQALRAAHEFAPNDVPIMQELAAALVQRADTEGAEGLARDRRRAAELYYLIAQVVSPSEAFAALQTALQLLPHHDGALQLLEQHAQQLGQEDVLPQYWSEYIAHAAEGPEVEQRRLSLARSYERAGRLDDAIACLEVVQTQGVAASLLTDLKVRRGPRAQAHRARASESEAARQRDATKPTVTEGASAQSASSPPLAAELEPTTPTTASSPALPGLHPRAARGRRKSSERPLDAERQLRELRRALRNDLAAEANDAAIERCKAIREIEPSDPEAFVLLELHFRKQADHAALRELLQSTDFPAATEDEHKQRLGEIAKLSEETLNDLPGALEAWSAVAEVDPADRAACANLPRLLRKLQRPRELAAELERQLLHAHNAELRASLLSQLVAVQREREDTPAAIDALHRLYALEPRASTRDELIELLVSSGAYGEAVPLLWQRAQEAQGEREHLQVLRQLAEIFETAVHEREAAFDVCTRILAIRPKDADALACMQRIDENSGNAARLLGTLERRAAFLPRDERASLCLEMAKIAERSLDDVDRAGEYYAKALELDPARLGTLDSLCELFASRERHQDLAPLLVRAAAAERDPARRLEIHLRQARLLSGPLARPTEAAAAYRTVLEREENTEALSYLLSLAREESDAEAVATLCARLAATLDEPMARRSLMYERAQVLVTELGRPHDAITTLRTLITDIDPDYEPAIEWLAELAGNLGDTSGLATALARRLDKSTTQDARVALAKRLADLHEYELGDHAQAIGALSVWAEADPKDPAPHKRLQPLLEEGARYAELAASYDVLANLESDGVARDEATLAAAQVAFTQLRNPDAAWARLLPLLQRGHPQAIQQLLVIARQTERLDELASVCVRAAQEAPELELQAALWGHATRIFREELGNPHKAFEAALRLLATDLKNRDALGRVEETAIAAGVAARLVPVFDRLVKAADSDAERIALLVRHADLIERTGGDPSDALDRVLQASGLAPADEALITRAERLAAHSGRGPELVRLCQQQATLAQQPTAQVEWLLRAARFAISTSDDRDAANAFLEAALAATRGDVSLWEQCVGFAQHLDAHAATGEPHAALRELIAAHRRVAELCPPPLAATLILRASRLLNDRLNDERAAFDLLRAGSALLPLDENLYDNLLERGESTNRLDALDTHLARGVDEALDARTASCLLSRRARLLEGPLGRPDEAANVYVKLLQLRPDDMQATGKLRDSLRRARRFQDLLVVIHKQIQRAKGPEEKLELLKESAHVWELDLKNRWEALDAWRKVVELAPQDAEALRALARLDRRSLPNTGIVAIEPDAVRAAVHTSSDASSAHEPLQASDASSAESGSQPALAMGDLPRMNLVPVDEVTATGPSDARPQQPTPSQSPPSGVTRRGSSRSSQPAAREAAPKSRSSAPPRKH